MEFVQHITLFFESINTFLYTYLLVFMLIACGIYFSIRTRFIQFRFLPQVLKILREKSHEEHVSPFGALMISTASRVGIGNIVGVAFAMSVGGVGALFWMWVTALLGGASAFVESTLAQVYKRKDGVYNYKGGPAYYIQSALGSRSFGIVFAISLIACFVYGFNGLQAYMLTSIFEIYIGQDSFQNGYFRIFLGILLAILVVGFFYGKNKSSAFIASTLVPVMAIGYFGVATFVIITHFAELPRVFMHILEQAFDFEAIFGGFAGSAMVIGIKRGLFSNEAGMGSAPNAAAAAHTTHPAKQGMVQTLSVFIDTLIICTATALVVLCSQENIQELKGMAIMQKVMQGYLGEFGLHFVSVAVTLFAFTSLIGNFFYAQMNFKFITDNKIALNMFRASAVLMVFVGTQIGFELAWELADVFMGIMAIINIVAIVLLGNIALRVLRDYEMQCKAGKDPHFQASSVGITNAECWK